MCKSLVIPSMRVCAYTPHTHTHTLNSGVHSPNLLSVSSYQVSNMCTVKAWVLRILKWILKKIYHFSWSLFSLGDERNKKKMSWCCHIKKWHLRSGNEKSGPITCKLNEKTVYSQTFGKRAFQLEFKNSETEGSLVYQNRGYYAIRLHQSELEAEWYEFRVVR